MKQRIYYIDFIRGIGILLMLYAHIPIGGEFNHIVYAFHMPLFFFVSGYLYNEKINLSNMKKKFIKLLPSYLFFSILGYLLWLVEFKPTNFFEAMVPLFHVFTFNNDSMPIVGAIWFITALLASEFIYFLLRQYIKNELLLLVCCLLLFSMSLLLGNIHFNLPFSINQSFVGLLFLHIGFLCAKWNIKQLTNIPILILIFFILGGCLAHYNGEINMRLSKYANPLIFFIAAILLIFTLWIFSYFLYSKKLRVIFVEKIGRYSIIWLGTNEIVINITKSLIYKMHIELLTNLIIVIFLTTIIEYFIQEFVIHSKLKKFFNL